MSEIQALSVFSSQGERSSQEDHVLVSQDKGIFVIADGFGGAESGAAAARHACEAVRGFLIKEAGDLEATLPFVLRRDFSLVGNVLFNALVHANRKIMAFNHGKNVHEKGGASLLAGFLDDDLLALANVGGCTAWMFRDGEELELVSPRNYARLYDPFDRNLPDALRVPLRAIGITDDLEPEIFEFRVRPGDWVLLQTDGLEPSVRKELLALHRKHLSPSDAGREGMALLKQIQCQDNTSVSLVIF